MSLGNFMNKGKISKSPKINSFNSYQKSYISPSISFFKKNNSKKVIKKISPSNKKSPITFIVNKNKTPKQISSHNSPYREKNDLLNKNIKNNLYNNNNNKKSNILPKFKKFEKFGKQINSINVKFNKIKINNNIKNNIKTNKKNYKKKIIINKEKLSKNLENNIIFNSLIDMDNSSSNNSKIKEYISESNNDELIKCNINNLEEINNKDEYNLQLSSNESAKKGENLNNINNAFDVGSISYISKNGSGSAKEKIIEEEIKNNKGFDKIIKHLNEEENCKALFHDKNNKNEIIKESIENNKIIENENNEIRKENIEIKEIINEHLNNDKENIDVNEENKKVVNNFIEDIFKDLDNNKNITITSNKQNEKSEESYCSKESKCSCSFCEESESESKKEKENNKKLVNVFINNIITDAEREIKEVVSNFIENIVNDAESEIKYSISYFIDNIVNDAESEIKDFISNFIDDIIMEGENDINNMIDNFIESIINDAENANKSMIRNFIDNIIIDVENEHKNIVSNFIDNIISNADDEESEKEENNENEGIIINNEEEINNKVNLSNDINNITNNTQKKNSSRNKGKFINKNIINEHKINEINRYSNESSSSNESQGKSDEEDKSEKISNNPINCNILNNINNLIKSSEMRNISNTLDNISIRKKDLFQSQEFPSTHIILTKYNLFQSLGKEANKKYKRLSSVRREYQRKRKYKKIVTENLQIIYDNHDGNSPINNNNYQHIYIKAKTNKYKMKKKIPLNTLSNIDKLEKIKPKLKNIIFREANKKYKFKRNIKEIFKKWKYLLNNNEKKDEKIIINNIIYNAYQNNDNEMIYKVPNNLISDQKEHFGYYDSNIKICYPINIKISKGIFYLINNRDNDYQYFNDDDEDMEIFVVKKTKKRRYSFQKNDNYTFNGTL